MTPRSSACYASCMPVPPRAVRAAARQGLELRRERRRVTVRPGGTAVGVARARDLAAGRDISYQTLVRMKAYFDRVVDAQAEAREDPESRPIDELRRMLQADFVGRRLTVKQLYEGHHLGQPFVLKNYKDILVEMEAAGEVSCSPPAAERPKRHGRPTMADKVLVTFPS
jgi:hypothetical protein